jgi:hypothetical protein
MGERLFFAAFGLACLFAGAQELFNAFTKGKMRSIYGDWWERERDGALFWMWTLIYGLGAGAGIAFFVYSLRP